MEKVQDEEKTADIFENDIAAYLDIFCKENKIEDMAKESQNRWNAAMMYIRRNVFSDSRILKRTRPLDGYVNNNYNNNYNNINQSNCNAYDIDKVNAVCDYYIYICNMYDKGVTISGFSKLTGIDESTIYDWGEDNGRKLSTSSFEIYKKLAAEYENSAESKLWSNKNPVAVMAILNKRFGWNMPGIRQEQDKKAHISADQPIRLDVGKDEALEIVDGGG